MSRLKLQQYLPLAVLKLASSNLGIIRLSPVATVLTACGIETCKSGCPYENYTKKLQQYLPLAVLKPPCILVCSNSKQNVATVLTACGIETFFGDIVLQFLNNVATVLTACGIETVFCDRRIIYASIIVATVLTACGIETLNTHGQF